MSMCDAIVRSAGMVNLQSSTEMIELPFQGDNSLDCRPEFIKHAAHAIFTGNEGFHNFGEVLFGEFGPIQVPFIYWSKADIAYRAMELGVPFHMTWSCYKGGDKHCGRCGTCVERLEAIDEAAKRTLSSNTKAIVEGGPLTRVSQTWDETIYDDNEFWRAAVKEKK